MKQAKTLVELATEIERQAQQKDDFLSEVSGVEDALRLDQQKPSDPGKRLQRVHPK